jgi:hypothetical protein
VEKKILSTRDTYTLRECGNPETGSQWLELNVGDEYQGRYATIALSKGDVKDLIHDLIILEARIK